MNTILTNSLISFFAGIASTYAITSFTIWLANNKKVSWKKVTKGALILVNKITNTFKPDYVIGLGRSGCVIGAIIAGNLGGVNFLSQIIKREFVGDGKMKKRVTTFPDSVNFEKLKGQKVLLVCCSNLTGGDLQEWLKTHEDKIKSNEIELETCSLFQSSTSLVKTDYFAFDAKDKNFELIHTGLPWMLTPTYKHSHKPK